MAEAPNGGKFDVGDGFGEAGGDRLNEEQTTPAFEIEFSVAALMAAIEDGVMNRLKGEVAIEFTRGKDAIEAGRMGLSVVKFVAVAQQQDGGPAFVVKLAAESGVVGSDATVARKAFVFIGGENRDFFSS